MDDLKNLSTYLLTWLERYRAAAKIAPSVQEAAEEVDWQIRVLETRPPEVCNVSTTGLDEKARLVFQIVNRLLPQMPEYGSAIDLRINSITTSSSSSANNYILQFAASDIPAAVDWARRAQESYQELQSTHRRRERVRELLTVNAPTIVSRFDSAVRAYQQAKLCVGNESGAALEMRTVLDALQGELYERARKVSRENMTWAVMSDRLASNDTGRIILRNEEVNRRALYEDLSAVAKQRGLRSIDSLWSRTLDHLFVVLAETR